MPFDASSPELIPLFRFFNRFQLISTEAKNAIAEICSIRAVSKNLDLQPIGHTCRTIYFISKGMARIYYYNHNGVDITDGFSFENNIIVRVESLFTGKPSKKGIQVLEDSEILAIDAGSLFSLYDRFHEVERLFRKIFEANHIETINRIESLQFFTAEQRYKTLLRDTPDIIKRVPLKYIASYLGITQVSLSRIRAQH